MDEINLENLTDEQCRIADILWSCDTRDALDVVVEQGGIEFAKIRDLMLVASFDNVLHTDDALAVLNKYRNIS